MAVKKAMSAKNGGPALKTAPSSKGTAKAKPARTTAARVVRAVRATAARATVAARKAAPARATATKSTATKTTAAKPTATKATPRKSTKATAKKGVAIKASATKRTAKSSSAPSSRATARKTTKAAATKVLATKAAATKVPAIAAPLRAPKIAATTSTAPTKRLRVGKNEKPWTAKELAVVRAALEADLARLRAEIAAAEYDLAGLMRDAGDGAGDDQADAGTKTFEREQEISLVNNAREVSEQSEHALERILDGSYGVCENCGNPIGKNRLLVFPRATLCVPCKSKQERR